MKDIIRPVQAPEQEGGYPYYNPMRALIGEDVNTGWVEINDNLGKIYSQGVEFDINYILGNTLLSVGYSYTDGEDNETRAKLPKVSQHKLNANVSYNSKKLFGSITTRYYSDIWTDPANSYYGVNQTNKGNIPGAFVVYLNAGYRITDKATLNASIDNVLNTMHWGSAPYAESIWIQPRAPQSLLKAFAGITFNL